MTTDLLTRAAEIAALDEKRTSGEWSIDKHQPGIVRMPEADSLAGILAGLDAAFIAAAPAMAALVAELAAALQTAQKQVELLMQEPEIVKREPFDEAAEREAFEKHCRRLWKEYGEDEKATMLSRYEDGGRYVVVATNNAWNGWQARAKIGRA